MNEEQGPDVTDATVALGGMEMENCGTPDEPGGKEDSDEWSDCTDSEDELPGEDEMWRVGLVEPPSIPESLNPEFFPSKVGGDPAWLDPENLPNPAELRCQANVRGETCGRFLTFLLQIYAPVYEGPADAFHRSLFVFVCANPLCVGKHGSCRVFRSQLPRKNAFYSFDPPEYPDERPKICEIEEDESVDQAAAAVLAVAAVDAGRGYKEAGNKAYKAGDYSGAILQYHEALAAMRVAAGAPAEEERQETYACIQGSKEEPWLREGGAGLREEYSKIRSNTGECHLKLGAFERAVSECTKALAADESNVKAWYRRAKGWIGISKREDGLAFGAPQKARNDLCSALRLDGDNAAALKELKLVRQLCKSHVRLVPQEIVIDEEPSEEECVETKEMLDAKRLLEAYQKKVAEVGGADAGVGRSGEEEIPQDDDRELDGMKEKVDPTYLNFKVRVGRMKNQALRYNFADGSKPLWMSSKGQCLSADVPKCPRCGAERKFEFQIMPQMLFFLEADAGDSEILEAKTLVTQEEAAFVHFDWGIMAVFSCAASCSDAVAAATGGGYAEEFVWLQDNPSKL